MITQQQFEVLLPLACAWAEEQERMILDSGMALNEFQMEDARRIGVVNPEHIRLMRVSCIPSPTHPLLASAAAATGLVSAKTAGLTVRYGIFIRSDCWGNRSLVAHECAHTMQYERLGGFEAFLRPYLLECITPPGYPYGPLEQEAQKLQREICLK
ncbi:MAG: hypothetical protein AB1650_01700 [Candidatus Omnitrophota bacterium]